MIVLFISFLFNDLFSLFSILNMGGGHSSNWVNYNGLNIQVDRIYEWECFQTQVASLFDIVFWITSLKTWIILYLIFGLRPKSCWTQQLTYMEKHMCMFCRSLFVLLHVFVWPMWCLFSKFSESINIIPFWGGFPISFWKVFRFHIVKISKLDVHICWFNMHSLCSDNIQLYIYIVRIKWRSLSVYYIQWKLPMWSPVLNSHLY